MKPILTQSNYHPPNFLQWDREDRDTSSELIDKMTSLSNQFRVKAINISETADIMTAVINERQSMKEQLLQTMFGQDDSQTEVAIDNELVYISNYKIHALNILVNILLKIFNEIQIKLENSELKKYFRMIRLAMLIKRSKSMFVRKKITNYLRICHRLNNINKLMPKYYYKKILWIRFNRWLKYLYNNTLNITNGLQQYLVRKSKLHPHFTHQLEKLGYQRLNYHNSVKFKKDISSHVSIFYRWQMITQEIIIFRLMEKKVYDLYKLKLLYKIFYSLKTHLNSKNQLKNYNNYLNIFPIKRLYCDLEQISKRFISHRRNGLPFTIQSIHKKYQTNLKFIGKSALSFKSFLNNFQLDISYRLVTEQRVLAESFELRGIQKFIDIKYPKNLKESTLYPSLMSRIEGKKFIDPKTVILNHSKNNIIDIKAQQLQLQKQKEHSLSLLKSPTAANSNQSHNSFVNQSRVQTPMNELIQNPSYISNQSQSSARGHQTPQNLLQNSQSNMPSRSQTPLNGQFQNQLQSQSVAPTPIHGLIQSQTPSQHSQAPSQQSQSQNLSQIQPQNQSQPQNPPPPPVKQSIYNKILEDEVYESSLPSGFQLKKLKFNFFEGNGIVGWQLIWGGDGTRDIESPFRGTWTGIGLIQQELVVPKDDFILGETLFL